MFCLEGVGSKFCRAARSILLSNFERNYSIFLDGVNLSGARLPIIFQFWLPQRIEVKSFLIIGGHLVFELTPVRVLRPVRRDTLTQSAPRYVAMRNGG